MLAELRHHDLGVHSGLVSDAILDLVECGDHQPSQGDRRLVVGHRALLGTDRLYRWADENPLLQMSRHLHAWRRRPGVFRFVLRDQLRHRGRRHRPDQRGDGRRSSHGSHRRQGCVRPGRDLLGERAFDHCPTVDRQRRCGLRIVALAGGRCGQYAARRRGLVRDGAWCGRRAGPGDTRAHETTHRNRPSRSP